MKLITTALVLAAIFFTKANSLDLLNHNQTPAKLWVAKEEKIVASCHEKHYVGLFTTLILSCGNEPMYKHFAIRSIGSGTNGRTKGANLLWKFDYSTDCQNVQMVFKTDG